MNLSFLPPTNQDLYVILWHHASLIAFTSGITATDGWHTDTVAGIVKVAKLGYMNAFILYTAMSVIAIPLVLLLGGRRRNA